MVNLEQAYIDGFVKRACAYGLTQNEAFELLKQAVSPQDENTRGPMSRGALTATQAGKGSGGMYPNGINDPRVIKALRLPTPPPVLQGPTPSGATLDTVPAVSVARPEIINPAHLNDLGRFTPR